MDVGRAALLGVGIILLIQWIS